MPYKEFSRVVYIAGPYSPSKSKSILRWVEIDENIEQARQAAITLANARVAYFSPHLNSAHFEVLAPDVPAKFWYDLDLYFLTSCEAILMLPGWENSKGSLKEKALMEQLSRPVFYNTDEVIEWASK